MSKVSVIVCTYNRDRLLRSCLLSLVDQTISKDLFEVIVVNNNSTDKTQEIAEEFAKTQPNFRVVIETKQGLSHARNRGYMEACGNYVAYIDDDARAMPDWAERILTAFEKVKPKPVVVGGKYLPWYKKSPPEWFTDELEIRTWGPEKGFLQPPCAQHGFSGSNMAFRKSILQSYNGFSPNFGMEGNKLRLGEETELFYRIYKDYPLFWYDPKIIVLHFVPEKNMSVRYRLKRAYLEGISSANINRQYPEAVFSQISILKRFRYVHVTLFDGFGKRGWKLIILKYAELITKIIGYLKGKMSVKKKSPVQKSARM